MSLKLFFRPGGPVMPAPKWLAWTILLPVSAITLPAGLSAQGDPVRKLRYLQTETVSYALPSGTDPLRLHPSDFPGTRGETTVIQKTVALDAADRMTVEETYTYDDEGETSHFTRPYRSVIDENGIRLFDASDRIYHQSPLSSGDKEFRLQISPEEVERFGFSPILVPPSEEELRDYAASGFLVSWSEENEITLSGNDLRISVNFDDQSVLEEYYKDGILHHSLYDRYSSGLESGMSVKLLSIEKTYRPLHCGVLMQKTRTIRYENYTVNDRPVFPSFTKTAPGLRASDGSPKNTVNFYDQESLKSGEIAVTVPNPCDDHLTVQTGANIHFAKYQIRNEQGLTLLSGDFDPGSRIRVSSLSPGIYFLQLSGDASNHFLKFVKK